MKKIIAIVCALACALCFFSCKEKKDDVKETVKDIKENEKVVGKGYYEGEKLVREEFVDDADEVVKKVFYSDDEKVEKEEEFFSGSLKSDTAYTYGEDGKYTTKKNNYNKAGEVKSVVDSEFADGKLTKETKSTLDKDGKATVTEENHYKYNEDGTVTKSQKEDGKTVKDTVSDAEGKDLYTVDYLENGTKQKKYLNDKGKVDKIENISKDDAVMRTVENLFDEYGQPTGYREYDENGYLDYYGEYKYVDKKLTGIIVYDADGEVVRTVTYDENGKAEISEN